eukprot:3863438-Rhodomonas_salina.2
MLIHIERSAAPSSPRMAGGMMSMIVCASRREMYHATPIGLRTNLLAVDATEMGTARIMLRASSGTLLEILTSIDCTIRCAAPNMKGAVPAP